MGILPTPQKMSDTTDNPLDAAVDLHALDELTFEGRQTVLDRLGPAHFRSKGFSFMGFLQTVYDHVAQHSGDSPSVLVPDTQRPRGCHFMEWWPPLISGLSPLSGARSPITDNGSARRW